MVASDVNGEAVERVAAAIREAGGQAAANVADTARHEDVKAAVEFARDRFGVLHLAVNNAGIGGSPGPLADLEIADWQRVIDINLSGVFYGMKYQIPAIQIEYSASGVRINSVHPGYIDTPLLDLLDRETYDGLKSLHPIGRLGKAEEVATVVAFLLSDEAAFVTGSQYTVDGGYTSP